MVGSPTVAERGDWPGTHMVTEYAVPVSYYLGVGDGSGSKLLAPPPVLLELAYFSNSVIRKSKDEDAPQYW